MPLTHGFSKTRTYRSWQMMRQRCDNKNHHKYKHYGARGITVCDAWSKFEQFLADMGCRPTSTSIDRINNDGNYEPSNCRWATLIEQARNKRRPALAKTNKSGFSGVHWSKRESRWVAYISVNRKRIHLGGFASKEDAVNARKDAESSLSV